MTTSTIPPVHLLTHIPFELDAELQQLWTVEPPLLVKLFAAPWWCGLGKILLHTGDRLHPHVVHTEQSSCEIVWFDSLEQPAAVQRLTTWHQGPGTLVIKDVVQATRDLNLAECEAFRFGIHNDLSNRFVRHVRDQSGKVHDVTMSLGHPRAISAGHVVTIDGRVKFEADQELLYISPAMRTPTPAGATGPQIDWLSVRCGRGIYDAGDTVRHAMVRIEAPGV